VATAEISPDLRTEITSVAELESLVGPPVKAVAEKVRPSLDAIDRSIKKPLVPVGKANRH
jgi:hypothetical protein